MHLSDDFLVESKTAREQGLTQLKIQRLEESVLNKVKVLIFAVWQGVGRITRQQLADFYEIPVETVDTNYRRHKDEFDLDGVQVLRGNDLRDARFIMNLASKSSQETIYTPAGALRMGFILRESQVAKAVRTAVINIIQGVGQELSSEIVLQHLIQAHPIFGGFTEGKKLKVSAPFSRYWLKMKSTLVKNYPNGGISEMSKDEIRKNIQFLSTYTDCFKLEGIKELRYELADEFKGKYPDLISDTFNFECDGEMGSAVIMFQFDGLITDVHYVENCIGRGYIQVAKEFLEVDKAYLIFVSPFGATSYAEDYIRKRLVSDYKGCVGVLTVKELASFLYSQAVTSRKLGTAKGELNSEFKKLLTYSFPKPPLIADQMELEL